jgi:chromosome segregation ATPase
MIKKISEDWSGIEQSAKRLSARGGIGDLGGGDEHELQGVLQEIAGVHSVLREMCRVSVTRATLRSALKEALLPLIEEHKYELFPELADLAEIRERLERAAGALPPDSASGATVPAELTAQMAGFEERLGRLADLEGEVKAEVAAAVSAADGRLSEVAGSVRQQAERLEHVERSLGDVAGRVAAVGGRLEEETRAVEGRLAGRLEEETRAVEGRLAGRLGEAETRLGKRQGGLEGRVREVDGRIGQVEASLRKELEEMVKALVEKLSELRDVLGRVEKAVPPRRTLEAMDERLGRLEESFARVALRIENIDSLTPELRGLGERLAALRGDLGTLSSDVGGAGRSLVDLRDVLQARTTELQGLLEGGIARWEDDQSQTLERLSAMRDTLRDQVRDVTAQVENTRRSFIGKVMGKDPGLKMSREEWDQIAARIEGIIAGLEAVLARKQPRR